MIATDVILIDRVEQANARHIELGVVLLKLAPEITDGAAVGHFPRDLRGARPFAQNREKFHFDFHFPWSWETMWRISGSISFSMASLTAPLEPGTEIRILPRAVPAAARLIIAAAPIGRASW